MSKILVVDDDRPTRHLIQLQLKKAGYRVETAPNGSKALELLRKKKFDLALVDVWMPEMDGLSMLAQLRTEPRQPRVVVMTADDTPQTMLRAIKEHAYRYVTKPIEPKALLELVKSVLAAESCGRPIEVLSARPNWVELLIPCERDSAERIQDFLAKLDADLPEDARRKLGNAFHELLMNAVEWGGKLDASKSVRISYLRAQRMILYRIADPGQGFSFKGLEHSALENPDDNPFLHTEIRENKGLRPGGFGLLMTQKMVDELLYNEAQNEVVFVKYLD
ncbi:MAG: response regulator [Acidobacteria bacterium]|nr:response regulator [Acidobacteriota bacterium]